MPELTALVAKVLCGMHMPLELEGRSRQPPRRCAPRAALSSDEASHRRTFFSEQLAFAPILPSGGVCPKSVVSRPNCRKSG